MGKQVLISDVLSRLDQLGISYSQGEGTDVSINCEFLNSSWGTGNKKISYSASVYFDESSQTVFMWELTKESGSGFSFGGDSETSFQSGTTIFRKVKSIKYGPDGKIYEYSLDLGSIPKVFKEVAKEYGWSFKTVLKKDKARYPQGYMQSTNEEIPVQKPHVQENSRAPKGKTGVLYWVLFAMLVFFDIVLFLGGSGILFLAFSAVVLAIMFVLRKKMSKGIIKPVVSFLIAVIVTFLIFAVTGTKDGNKSSVSVGNEKPKKTAEVSVSVGSKDKVDVVKEGFARSIEESTLKPIEKTNVFKPNDGFIYYSILVKHLPEDTKIVVKWYYEGKLQVETEADVTQNVTENRYYTAHLQKGEKPFPVGKYKVEIIMSKEGNEIYKCSDEFTVNNN